MNCYICEQPLIWNNDFSFEDYLLDNIEGIVTVLSCTNPKCRVDIVEVYQPENPEK